MTMWKIGNMYTNRRKWLMIHFLLLVYIFPIFHSVISFLHEPCLPQFDLFPSISVHISYLPVSFLSFLHEPCISQLDPFPSINVHISYLPVSFLSFLHEPCISQLYPFLSISVLIYGSSWGRQGSCRKEMTLWKIGNTYTNRRKWLNLRKTGFV
jgi:hypothetical protein